MFRDCCSGVLRWCSLEGYEMIYSEHHSEPGDQVLYATELHVSPCNICGAWIDICARALFSNSFPVQCNKCAEWALNTLRKSKK